MTSDRALSDPEILRLVLQDLQDQLEVLEDRPVTERDMDSWYQIGTVQDAIDQVQTMLVDLEVQL